MNLWNRIWNFFLRIFIIEKPFKVVQLDKNVGAALISNELFNDLAYDLLNDENCYDRIEDNPLDFIIISIEKELWRLYYKKFISNELFHALIEFKHKLGSFRFLP
jgi:hypothetical protein